MIENSLNEAPEVVRITKVTNSQRADSLAPGAASTSDAPAARRSSIGDSEKNAGENVYLGAHVKCPPFCGCDAHAAGARPHRTAVERSQRSEPKEQALKHDIAAGSAAECPRCGKAYGDDLILDQLITDEGKVSVVIHRSPGGCGEVSGLKEFRVWNEPRRDMKNAIASGKCPPQLCGDAGQTTGCKFWDKIKCAPIARLVKLW